MTLDEVLELKFKSLLLWTHKSLMNKVVLITGGSSGIGKSIGEFLHHKGYIVYGTSRNPEKIINSIFPLLTLDVRNSKSIQSN